MALSHLSAFRAVEAILQRQKCFRFTFSPVQLSVIITKKRQSAPACSCVTSAKTKVSLKGTTTTFRQCLWTTSPTIVPPLSLIKRGFTGASIVTDNPLFTKKKEHFSSNDFRNSSTSSQSKQDLKPNLHTEPGAPYHELPIIFINATPNNTKITITDHEGKTSAWASAGSEGFKNAKRGTNVAGQAAGVAAAKKATALGIKNARVKVKGMGPGRQTSVRGLLSGGIEIVSITDVTPIPHGGYRPRKKRRL